MTSSHNVRSLVHDSTYFCFLDIIDIWHISSAQGSLGLFYGKFWNFEIFYESFRLRKPVWTNNFYISPYIARILVQDSTISYRSDWFDTWCISSSLDILELFFFGNFDCFCFRLWKLFLIVHQKILMDNFWCLALCELWYMIQYTSTFQMTLVHTVNNWCIQWWH